MILVDFVYRESEKAGKPCPSVMVAHRGSKHSSGSFWTCHTTHVLYVIIHEAFIHVLQQYIEQHHKEEPTADNTAPPPDIYFMLHFVSMLIS